MPAVLLEILDAGHDDDLAYIVAHVRSLADAVRLVGTACSRFRAVAHRAVEIDGMRTSVALPIERCRTALATLAETLHGFDFRLNNHYMPTELRIYDGAKSEAKPRKPAKYLGIFQVYPQNTRYFANFADFGTKTASDSAQSQKIDDFHGVFSGK